MAHVEVVGGVKVQLKRHGASGLLDPGWVPPDTYTVVATFDGVLKEVRVQTLEAGDEWTLRCVKEMKTCR